MRKYKAYPFFVFLNPKPGQFLNLQKICSDIAEKDPTFIYHPQKRRDRILLFVESKDEGHKKSMWLFHKTDTLKYYAVCENRAYSPELAGQSE